MNIHDPDVIIKLHDALVEEFGGEKGLLNEHLLFSALARPFMVYPMVQNYTQA